MGLMVKLIPHIPAVEIVMFRSAITLVISLVLLKAQRVNPWGTQKQYLILRGVFGAMALVSYFITLQAVPIASATVLSFSAPIFTTFFGIFIVKEKVNPLQWLFFGLSFVGVLLTVGFDARVGLRYFGFGIFSAICVGLAQNFIRKIGKKEHALVILLYFPLVALPITGLYCLLIEWKNPSTQEWLYLIGIGLATQIAQYSMTKAIQLEELSKITILKYLSVIFAVFYSYAVFDQHYDRIAFLGMSLTVLAAITNVIWKNWKNRQLKSKAKVI
jgi:drug/metabolite transporter (DMT)-like permease